MSTIILLTFACSLFVITRTYLYQSNITIRPPTVKLDANLNHQCINQNSDKFKKQ